MNNEPIDAVQAQQWRDINKLDQDAEQKFGRNTVMIGALTVGAIATNVLLTPFSGGFSLVAAGMMVGAIAKMVKTAGLAEQYGSERDQMLAATEAYSNDLKNIAANPGARILAARGEVEPNSAPKPGLS